MTRSSRWRSRSPECPDGRGPAIGFLRVPESKTAKNRVHIDVRVAGEPPWNMAEREKLIRAKVAELVAAGATTTHEESCGDHLGHVAMRDPVGNEFCVATSLVSTTALN